MGRRVRSDHTHRKGEKSRKIKEKEKAKEGERGYASVCLSVNMETDIAAGYLAVAEERRCCGHGTSSDAAEPLDLPPQNTRDGEEDGRR